VRKVVSLAGKVMRLERMMDDGYDVVEAELPLLFTVVKEINEPRIPSLKGKMKAKKQELVMLSAADINADPDLLGLKGSPTQVVKVFPPEMRGERCMLAGTADEQVTQLAARLKAIL